MAAIWSVLGPVTAALYVPVLDTMFSISASPLFSVMGGLFSLAGYGYSFNRYEKRDVYL
jgi:hypothetical protein